MSFSLQPENLHAIEQACERLATSIGPDRVEAEAFLMKLRSSHDALQVARAVMDCSQLPTAQFQAAVIMREAVLKDWSKLTVEQRGELKNHVVTKVIEGCKNGTMKPFIRSQLLQVFGVMVKRYIFDGETVIPELLAMVQSMMGDPQTRSTGIYIVLASLQEFSSTTRSVAGLPIEFHHSCVVNMNKDGHLKAIFVMMMSLLHSSFDDLRALQAAGGFASAVESSGPFSWVEPCIAVLNLIFSWDFSEQEDKAGVMSALSVNRGEIITPGPLWRDVLVQPATIDLFYSLHSLCRENQKLGHEVRQCLVDLAAIRGDVFADEVSSQAYFEHTLRSSLSILTDKTADEESVDVALILKRLLSNFPAHFLIGSASAQMHLEHLTIFSCTVMVRARGVEDVCWQEALDHVIEMWSGLGVTLMHDRAGAARAMVEVLKPFSARVFRGFVEKCMREAAEEVEGWSEGDEEHEDRSILEERLTAIGCIGRPFASDSVSVLREELTTRVDALSGLAQGAGGAKKVEVHTVLEQLHWLVRIAGHVLADEGEGEVPCIPEQISIISHEAGVASGGDTANDPVALLTNAIVRLLQLQSDCQKGEKSHLASPLLATSCCWFFTRWSLTFLLPTSSECFPVSSNLLQLYGSQEGAQSVLSFLLMHVHANLEVYATEDDVLIATGDLVVSLAGRKEIGRMLVASPGWLDLANTLYKQLERPRTTKFLLPAVLEKMVHALCASVAALEDQVQKTTLLKNIIGPVRQSLEATLSTAAGSGGNWLQHGGGDAFHAALSMFQGACKAGDFYTYDVSYELAAPALKSFPPLLDSCGEYNDIVGAIVHLYLAIAEYQVSFMSEFQMRLFNEACLLLLQAFAQAEDGRRTVAGQLVRELKEQWLQEHLISLLQLLLHLARKDVADFANESGAGAMDVADVVFYGLSIVQPLVTPQSLEHPQLATEFFGLLGWLIETYPHKVSTLSRERLDPMMSCLAHGLQQADSEIVRVSAEAVDALATHQISSGMPYPLKANHPDILNQFLESILGTLLFKQFNRGVLEASCDALHSLMWCENQQFQTLMTQVLDSQDVSSQREEVQRATTALLSVISSSGPAVQRAAKLQFRKHMREFLGSVRPFLVKV